MPRTIVSLLGRPGCHLCDEARAVVERVVADERAGGSEIGLEELSVLDDPALEARWHDDVPVVLVDGRLHGRWRIDPEALRRALRPG